MSTILVDGVSATPSAEQLAALVAPPLAPQPKYRTKFELYAVMTDFELDALDTFLQGTATTRQRLEWTDAQIIAADSPQVIEMATQLFGAARAAEILA
jgi:hypothetical protein